MIESAIYWLLGVLAVPDVGLTAIFIVSFISATLIPLSAEPVVFAVVKANEAMFWPVLAVATIGNTLGGMVDYWMGYGAKQAFARERQTRWFGWFRRFGAKTLLMGWMPGVGDPLCTLAGWLKIPFWPSVFYMAIGKFLRYLAVTLLLLRVPDGFWHRMAEWMS